MTEIQFSFIDEDNLRKMGEFKKFLEKQKIEGLENVEMYREDTQAGQNNFVSFLKGIFNLRENNLLLLLNKLNSFTTNYQTHLSFKLGEVEVELKTFDRLNEETIAFLFTMWINQDTIHTYETEIPYGRENL